MTTQRRAELEPCWKSEASAPSRFRDWSKAVGDRSRPGALSRGWRASSPRPSPPRASESICWSSPAGRTTRATTLLRSRDISDREDLPVVAARSGPVDWSAATWRFSPGRRATPRTRRRCPRIAWLSARRGSRPCHCRMRPVAGPAARPSSPAHRPSRPERSPVGRSPTGARRGEWCGAPRTAVRARRRQAGSWTAIAAPLLRMVIGGVHAHVGITPAFPPSCFALRDGPVPCRGRERRCGWRWAVYEILMELPEAAPLRAMCRPRQVQSNNWGSIEMLLQTDGHCRRSMMHRRLRHGRHGRGRPDLEKIKEKGSRRCGVSNRIGRVIARAAQGKVIRHRVDSASRIAAAFVFAMPNKVKFVP